MINQSKNLIFMVCICVFLTHVVLGFEALGSIANPRQIKMDSLIKEKSISNDMTQLELLLLYQDAFEQKHTDSINIFRNLAILNAELEQPKDALKFTEKYIQNTLDFSILKNGSYEFIKETNEYKTLNKKYLPQITVLSLIYFCVALAGFYFLVVINFVKNINKKTKLYIGCFVGAHALFILEFVLFMTNLQYQFPHTFRISSSVALLFGPLLFLYFKSILEEHKFKTIDFLHFAPSLVFLIFFTPIYSMTEMEKLKLMTGINNSTYAYDFVIFILKLTSLSIYAFLINKLLFPKLIINVSEKDNTTKWKRNIFILHVAYIVSYLVYGMSIFDVLGSWSPYVYHFQMALMSLMVVYIVHMVYLQPEIFRINHLNLIEKYQKSGLTTSLSNELKENLIKLLAHDKVFKENNINLEILSNKLSTTRHNTSQIINEHFGMNFFELINKFRIKEAVYILKDDVHGSLNIIDVAYEVGYNNKVTFNKAFKKEMSVTPSEFIQLHIKNS